MLYNAFFTKSTLSRAVAGTILTLFALASIFSTFPTQFANAATITGLTATAFAEDSSKTTLGVGDQLLVSLNYQTSVHELSVNGACTINGKDVAPSFQSFQDGTFQLVYTVGAGDADAAAGQIPVNCSLVDAAGDTIVLTAFTSANSVAVDTTPDSGGGDTGGGDGGGTDLPPAGTFTVTADPTTGTLNPGDTLIVRANDTGGVIDFALDPAGTCTINGKDVKASFQSFNDHTYQIAYTVAQGDTNVAAGQVAVSCAVKNPVGTTATIGAFTDNNTVAISGGSTGGGNTGGGSTDTDSDTSGDLDGNVEGGNNGQNGVLTVTNINQVRATAIADGTLENGWKWIFQVTIPSDETKLQMKFGNWMHTNNTNWISPANNMRISSVQAAGGATNHVLVGAPDTYTSALDITGDMNPSLPGRQIEVVVEMGVPVGSLNGAYDTTYFVKTSQN